MALKKPPTNKIDGVHIILIIGTDSGKTYNIDPMIHKFGEFNIYFFSVDSSELFQ